MVGINIIAQFASNLACEDVRTDLILLNYPQLSFGDGRKNVRKYQYLIHQDASCSFHSQHLTWHLGPALASWARSQQPALFAFSLLTSRTGNKACGDGQTPAEKHPGIRFVVGMVIQPNSLRVNIPNPTHFSWVKPK